MVHEQKLHPPLKLWKFAFLMVATASLYQFVWLYRTAQDLRTRDQSITPWHWVAAPLLGPLMAIITFYLAVYMQSWQEDEDCEPGHFAEPILVAMFTAVAFLPTLLIVIETSIGISLALVVALLVCIPYLILQNQLNLIKAGRDEREFTSEPWRFSRHQWVIAAIGSIIVVPVYVLGLSDVWERRSSSGLALESVVESEHDFFQLRVRDSGWSQIDTGYLADESDLEFLGPDDWTWAVVYNQSGSVADDVLMQRINIVREDSEDALCEHRKTLIEANFVVRGQVICTGQSPLEGRYAMVTRVLSREHQAVEILAYTAQHDSDDYEAMVARLNTFVDGLEIVD